MTKIIPAFVAMLATTAPLDGGAMLGRNAGRMVTEVTNEGRMVNILGDWAGKVDGAGHFGKSMSWFDGTAELDPLTNPFVKQDSLFNHMKDSTGNLPKGAFPGHETLDSAGHFGKSMSWFDGTAELDPLTNPFVKQDPLFNHMKDSTGNLPKGDFTGHDAVPDAIPGQLPIDTLPAQLPIDDIPAQMTQPLPLSKNAIPENLPMDTLPAKLPKEAPQPLPLSQDSILAQSSKNAIPENLPMDTLPAQLPKDAPLPLPLSQDSIPAKLSKDAIPEQLPIDTLPAQLPKDDIPEPSSHELALENAPSQDVNALAPQTSSRGRLAKSSQSPKSKDAKDGVEEEFTWQLGTGSRVDGMNGATLEAARPRRRVPWKVVVPVAAAAIAGTAVAIHETNKH